MSKWSSISKRITATVRTTNRMNALLSESLLAKRRALQRATFELEMDGEEKLKNELIYFHSNFNMEHVHKIIENCIEERMTWDRFSRSYDSWRSLQMAECLAADIRDRVRKLNYRRHRIVCVLSVIEKQSQGIYMRMKHLMDEKRDNFTQYVYERSTYIMVVVFYLVYKE